MQLSRDAVNTLEQNSATTSTIHYLRFNVALVHAALGERDAAVAAYQRAMHCLEPAHNCLGGAILSAEVRAEAALWALADVELLKDSTDTDGYREAIMGAVNSGTPVREGWSGAELDIYPQELQISTLGEAPAEAAAIWYYRPDDKVAWGVVRAPSLTTVHAGRHLNRPVAAAQLLSAGEYRADIYTGGKKVASLSHHGDLGKNFYRWSSSQLGVSVVTPSDWAVQEEVPGVDWSLGLSPETGVALRRKDGQTPQGVLTEYLQAQLDQWVTERFSSDVTNKSRPPDDQYFLGMSNTVVRAYEDLNITAAAAFAPYASDLACGGTLIMAVVGGAGVDPGVVDSVFESLVLEEPPLKTPDIGSTYLSERFSVDIPEGWTAVSRPPGGTGSHLRVGDCWTGTNVLITDEALDERTVDGEIEASLRTYRAEFPEFELQARRPLKVSGSNDATEIVFSWKSENGIVRQRQVFAANANTLLYLTFTTLPENLGQFSKDAELMINSLKLLPR